MTDYILNLDEKDRLYGLEIIGKNAIIFIQ